MIHALLALALVSQNFDEWSVDDDTEERLILAFSAYDMRIGRRTSFRISEVDIYGERMPFVQRMIVQRQGRSRHQLTATGCPAFRGLLRSAAALPMPSPGLVRIGPIAPGTRAAADWYRLEGSIVWPDGRREPIRVESVEEEGGEPSPIAGWGRSLMQAFQACVERDMTEEEEAGEEGTEDD